MLILKTQKKQMNKYIEQLDKEREQQLSNQANQALKRIADTEEIIKSRTNHADRTWGLGQIERMKRYVKKYKYLPGSFSNFLDSWSDEHPLYYHKNTIERYL